jgi:hypothetical protein
VLVVVLASGIIDTPEATAAPSAVAPDEAAARDTAALAVEAYAYAYPLVLTELARRMHVAAGTPVNRFAHQRALADAATADPLRPNADVLTSTLFFDVSEEPLVVSIPEGGERWWTLPMFDAWMDVFAAPGPRTSGGGAQAYALVAPGWTGTLPAALGRIEAPTPTGWMAARIATHGTADYATVHGWQDGLAAHPLSAWGNEPAPAASAAAAPAAATRTTAPDGMQAAPPTPATQAAAPAVAAPPIATQQPPAAQILRLSAADYFGLFATLTAADHPHANDWSVLRRIARLGLVPGAPFALDRLPPDVQAVLQQTPRTAGQALFDAWKRAGTRVNGWRSLLTPMGAYGTDYRRRQVVAYSAFGADTSDDVYFLTTIAAGDGQPLESSQRYVLHFDAGRLPPVRAFWSVTAYDERNLLPLGKRPRVTIGSRDPLVTNADGSLDLYLQAKPPATDHLANWLPTPAEGRFSLTMRLYWPEPPALDGMWTPPGVTLAAGEKPRGAR